MTEFGKRTDRYRHLWRNMAAWTVGSVVVGVLLGRYLKQVAEDYPLAEPSVAPASKSLKPRFLASSGKASDGR
jgi:hypothetical protein